MKEDNPTSKKSSVKIDTGAFIRQVAVAGSEDMPKSIQADNQPEVIGNSNEQESTIEEKPKESPKKKRGQSIDYETVFLVRNELRNRQGLYIDKENYEVLQTLVRSITNDGISTNQAVSNRLVDIGGCSFSSTRYPVGHERIGSNW
jgi:predicted metal-dependent RNase